MAETTKQEETKKEEGMFSKALTSCLKHTKKALVTTAYVVPTVVVAGGIVKGLKSMMSSDEDIITEVE